LTPTREDVDLVILLAISELFSQNCASNDALLFEYVERQIDY
jgi:hypothetical protein